MLTVSLLVFDSLLDKLSDGEGVDVRVAEGLPVRDRDGDAEAASVREGVSVEVSDGVGVLVFVGEILSDALVEWESLTVSEAESLRLLELLAVGILVMVVNDWDISEVRLSEDEGVSEVDSERESEREFVMESEVDTDNVWEGVLVREGVRDVEGLSEPVSEGVSE